jgi:hypothetical protein
MCALATVWARLAALPLGANRAGPAGIGRRAGQDAGAALITHLINGPAGIGRRTGQDAGAALITHLINGPAGIGRRAGQDPTAVGCDQYATVFWRMPLSVLTGVRRVGLAKLHPAADPPRRGQARPRREFDQHVILRLMTSELINVVLTDLI